VQKQVNMRDHDMNLQLRPNFTLGERRLPFECVALVLQGGGALGAYQGGVYEALAEAKIHPDWIAGVSIDAINAAIIAGNPPNARVDAARCRIIGAPAIMTPSTRCAIRKS
jgi:NTE family protein